MNTRPRRYSLTLTKTIDREFSLRVILGSTQTDVWYSSASVICVSHTISHTIMYDTGSLIYDSLQIVFIVGIKPRQNVSHRSWGGSWNWYWNNSGLETNHILLVSHPTILRCTSKIIRTSIGWFVHAINHSTLKSNPIVFNDLILSIHT